MRYLGAFLLVLLTLAGCGGAGTAATTRVDSESTVTTATSTSAPPTSTAPPTDTTTQPPTSTGSDLPTLTAAGVAHVKLSPGYEAVGGGYRPVAAPVSILSAAVDPDLISQLLAAYAKALPDPTESPDGQPARWTLTFSLTDGTEVEVRPTEPGGDLVSILAGAHPDDPAEYKGWAAHAPELVALADAFRAPGTADHPKTLPATRPPDFGFILGYGMDARYVIDSFAGTFTKDLVSGVPSTAIARVTLTPAELDDFYRRFVAVGIADYPALFDPKPADPNTEVLQTPFSTYSLRLRVGGVDIVVGWADEHVSQDPQAVALRKLCQDIAKAMEAKPEVKALPQANGGYA